MLAVGSTNHKTPDSKFLQLDSVDQSSLHNFEVKLLSAAKGLS